MSYKNVICETPPQQCKLCGAIEETRPYGKNGEEICFTCGMKDEQTAIKRFRQHVFGEELDS